MDLKERILTIMPFYQNGSSAAATFRAFKTQKNLHDNPFSLSTVTRVVKKFEVTGSALDAPRAGRPSVSEKEIAIVGEAVGMCQGESARGYRFLRQVSAECDLPLFTVYKIMRPRLALRPYKPSFVMRDFLAKHFHERVIGCGFYWFWPPRSPDVTPCDFWFRAMLSTMSTVSTPSHWMNCSNAL